MGEVRMCRGTGEGVGKARVCRGQVRVWKR